MARDDAYGRIDFRQLIAWSSRLDREWPFLDTQLASAPLRRVVDLGCGPGEHLARFHREGWSTLGIDRSPAQIASARQHHPEVDFLEGSIEELAALDPGSFGAALCLGNVLASLGDEELRGLVGGLAARLLPGGIFIAQLVDSSRIRTGQRRALPVTVRPADDGTETVFLRVYAPDPDPRYFLFLPATLRLTPAEDPPLGLASAQVIRHRAWSAEELEAVLGAAGFAPISFFGGLDGSAHGPTSDDLVVVAVRSA